MKNILLQVGLAILLFTLRGASAQQTFGLVPDDYPDVGDHHCLAWACANIKYKQTDVPRGGFHRATSSRYVRNRRHAIGCDGVTHCGSGRQCDEIPYASTFDGGLSCFSSEWTNSGRALANLYSWGTHRCVSSHDNAAHGNAVGAFYRQSNVANFEEYYIAWILNSAGCTNARWCNSVINAQSAGGDFRAVCAAARNDGRQFALVTQSQYTQAPRCPSHHYRRDTDEIEDDLEDEVEALPSNATALDVNTTRVASPRIGHLENGMKVMEVWGKLSIGDRIWIHDKTFLNGTHSEIVNMTTFEEAFGHLQSRQQC
ncbi:hypothetical protein PLICRDRAFT_47891 [Plicaturopsis crispa FD-325 SS-3]|nr:hypothetical protein PLICRDRAFT_47891 [Plicaturopsis crispa FD-325 SS-3]